MTLCAFYKPIIIITLKLTDIQWQFTILMHYSSNSDRQYPLIATLRARILSVLNPQQRFVVRGTRGTYTKYGVDVQEEQLKAIKSPNAILEEGFGKEPEELWGVVENIEADGVSIRKAMWVFRLYLFQSALI